LSRPERIGVDAEGDTICARSTSASNFADGNDPRDQAAICWSEGKGPRPDSVQARLLYAQVSSGVRPPSVRRRSRRQGGASSGSLRRSLGHSGAWTAAPPGRSRPSRGRVSTRRPAAPRPRSTSRERPAMFAHAALRRPALPLFRRLCLRGHSSRCGSGFRVTSFAALASLAARYLGFLPPLTSPIFQLGLATARAEYPGVTTR